MTKFTSFSFQKIILIVWLILQASLAFGDSSNYKLIFAVDVVRHGDRTPVINLPGDDHLWKQGLMQLTPEGASRLFVLGSRLRHYYVEQTHLLTQQFNNQSMYVRSSDYDRTLMSAQALLAGLYPSGTGPRGFALIPIHTVDTNNDDLILPSQVDKKRYKSLVKRYVYTQPAWKEKEKQLTPKLAQWSQQSGYPVHNLNELIKLEDALYVRKHLGIKLPAGISNTEADEIIAQGQWALAYQFSPRPIGLFMAHTFFITLKQNMQKASAADNQLKYILYTAHESNILGLMSALGLPLQQVPPYAADLRFELLKDSREQQWIRVSYNNQILRIPGCEQLCDINQFFTLIKD